MRFNTLFIVYDASGIRGEHQRHMTFEHAFSSIEEVLFRGSQPWTHQMVKPLRHGNLLKINLMKYM